MNGMEIHGTVIEYIAFGMECLFLKYSIWNRVEMLFMLSETFLQTTKAYNFCSLLVSIFNLRNTEA